MAVPSNTITIYGRNAVYEALSDANLKIYALHLSSSNKASEKIDRFIKIAKQRDIEIKYHPKERLSYISKNKKQDQGVALDIILDNFATADSFKEKKRYRILALDSIENPQNLGMIIRSAAAGNIDAIIVQKRGTASLVSPLTIKASVGTLFRMPIIYTDSLAKTVREFIEVECEVINLSLDANSSLFETMFAERSIFILGNETRGVSKELSELASKSVKIPMRRGVESLNVAITAAIIAFL